MPGFWEIKQQRFKVFGYFLHTEIVSTAWAMFVRTLQIPGPLVPVCGMPYDHGRNQAAQQCLDGGYEWLFSIDSDVIAPPDVVFRLMAHNLPVVSGLYCRRSPPHSVPVMMRGGNWITKFVPGSLVEVDWCGAGALLVHRSVLEKLPPHRPGKPYFDWRVDMQGHLPREECLSEDYTFMSACKKKLGISTFVDTSVVCKHGGFAEFTYGKVEPLRVAAA